MQRRGERRGRESFLCASASPRETDFVKRRGSETPPYIRRRHEFPSSASKLAAYGLERRTVEVSVSSTTTP